MNEKTITAFFDRFEDALDAVKRLEDAGFQHKDIALISNNEGDRHSHHAGGRRFDRREDLPAESETGDGAATGATVGTLAGGGAGLLAGLGMMAIPGLGPVVAAGWLVATLTGAGAGAAIGGLGGALVEAGVDESDANAYAEGVRRGGALVTVRASEAQVDRIVDILDDEGTVDLEERQGAWREEGWTGGRNPALGAAGSMSTGLATGLMDAGTDPARTGGANAGLENEASRPVAEPLTEIGSDATRRTEVEVEVEVEDERRRRGTGTTDRDRR